MLLVLRRMDSVLAPTSQTLTYGPWSSRNEAMGYIFEESLRKFSEMSKVLRLKASDVEALIVPADQCRGW